MQAVPQPVALDVGGKRKLDAMSIYITPELKKKLEKWAAIEQRSLSNFVVYLLTKTIEEKEQDEADS